MKVYFAAQSKLTWIGPLRITLENSGRNCLHFTIPDIKMKMRLSNLTSNYET